MQDQESTENNRIRSLENWLPLAQAENVRNGWGLNGAELEQLVHDARTALELTGSLLGARAVLYCFEALLFLDANFPEGDALPEFVHMRALLHQIHQLLPAERRNSVDKRNLLSLHRVGTSLDRVPPQLLRTLRRAIWRQEISFEYVSNQPGAPRVWHRTAPYEIIFKPDGHAYLDAATLQTEPSDTTVKLPIATSYRLDRIAGETLRILPTTLPPHRLGVRTYTIRYRLHPNVARRKDIAHHFPDSQVVYHDDESATISAKATNLWQARQTLFRYGSACVVEEPPELVELFKKAIREMANSYGL